MHVCVGPQLYLFCSHHLSWRTFMDTLASFYTRTDAGTAWGLNTPAGIRGSITVGTPASVTPVWFSSTYTFIFINTCVR